MLELAALGLLQKEPLHGYRLKQQLELFMSGCISANYGAIYPLLKRLEKKGAIEVFTEEADSSEVNRKIYRITDVGKCLWKKKMLSYPKESWVHARSRFMIKFFFFSTLESEERLKLLEHRLLVCRLKLEQQEKAEKLGDPYQAKACDRYIEVIKNEIEWLNEQFMAEIAQHKDIVPNLSSNLLLTSPSRGT